MYVETAEPEVSALVDADTVWVVWLIAGVCLGPVLPIALRIGGFSEVATILFLGFSIIYFLIGSLSVFALLFEYCVETPQF